MKIMLKSNRFLSVFSTILFGWICILTESEKQVLDLDAIATLSTIFDQVESVQLYHLLSDSTIFEQGTVNKELMFYETAIGFWATSSNEKAVLSYEPDGMKLSLLPEIAISSNEGYQVAWQNYANVYYETDIDSSVWDSITYMGTMGGSTFKYLLDYALQFSEKFNYYQPFSVYEQYPGNRFIAATSCDEFVWFLFEQLASLQISLNPVVVPKKVKIILYSHCAPEIYSMNSTQHKTEVASYFQQMKRCLHIRSLQHITTLSEFTGFYSGCLVEYAYLYKDPFSLYKVNLTIPYADNVNPTEDVPQPIGYESGFSWVDICLAILIVGAFVAGVALALRKSLVLEKYGYQKETVKHHRLKEDFEK